MNTQQWSTVAELSGFLIVIGTVVFLAMRLSRIRTYRIAIGIAIFAVFFITWVNLAVGIIGEPDNLANLMYFGVPLVGVVGALVARFQPTGMARALLVTAVAQGLVAVTTAVAGLGYPPTPLVSLLILNGVLMAMWGGSALLFQKAARIQTLT